MSRSLLLAACLCLPAIAGARSLEREGTVTFLPGARRATSPGGLDAGGFAPGLTVAFGFKPSQDLRVGLDVGASAARGELPSGRYELVTVPLLLAFDWILLPEREIRPVLQGGIGKQFLAVQQGSYYREHTPTIVQVAAGIHADLSDDLGLVVDAGYLHARATDERLGRLDGGGPFVRAGLTLRLEPSRRLR